MNRSEYRCLSALKPLLCKFKDSFDKKLVFKLNQSKTGLGCLALSNEFQGPGSIVKIGESETYIVRWVKVHFLFIHLIGMESIENATGNAA